MFIGEGSQRKKLEKKAEELGIRKEVVFTGSIPNEEIQYYLQACDLFLFASKSETQGIVLAEALAAGIPVIAVKAVGVDDIVYDGKNGFRTGENIEQWAEKAVLALNPRQHESLKRQALISAQAYRAEQIALHEESLYVQCILRKQEELNARRKLEEGWSYRERRGSRA